MEIIQSNQSGVEIQLRLLDSIKVLLLLKPITSLIHYDIDPVLRYLST